MRLAFSRRSPEFIAAQFWLPLVCLLPTPVVKTPAKAYDPDLERAFGASDEETARLLLDAGEYLHQQLLWRSIEILGEAGNADVKLDILSWIFRADLLRDEAGNVVDNRDEPFSFPMCCQFIGVDPDAMRDRIDEMLEAARKLAVRKHGKPQ